MNKNVIIGLVLIVLAGAGYYQFSYKPSQEAAMAQKAADEAATKAAADAAAVAKAAEDEAAAAAKKVEDEAAAAAAAATTTTEAPAATTEAPAATTEAPAATTEAAPDAMAVLDPANFDAAKINAMIDASTLDDATKGTLKSGVDAAATNPALVEGAISAVKAALGM